MACNHRCSLDSLDITGGTSADSFDATDSEWLAGADPVVSAGSSEETDGAGGSIEETGIGLGTDSFAPFRGIAEAAGAA